MHSAPGRRSVPGRGRLAGERGYAMAALLVGMGVMAVMLTVAMPVWSTQAKRAREDELVFRGEQYARAIMLYQRKYANASPPSIDVLVNERFLRRKYKDPMTGDDFQPLTCAAGASAPVPGAVGRGGPVPGRQGGLGGGGGTGSTGGFGAARSSGSGPTASQGPTSSVGRGTTGGGTGGIGSGGAGGRGAGTTGSPFGGGGGIVGVASKSKEKSLRLYNG